MIVLLTIDNYRHSKFGCNSQPKTYPTLPTTMLSKLAA